MTAPAEGSYDTATHDLNAIMNDLGTYRFVPQVTVTPALARRIIDLNAENNRVLTANTVRRYARDMTNGHWREKTGQTIKIDTRGRLIDGQQRMHAVVTAGCPVVFDLAFGIEPDDMIVVDNHKPRRSADVIRISGGGDISRVSPVVNHVLAYEAGFPKGPNGTITATPIEVHERYLADPKMFEAAAARGIDCARRGVGTPAALGTAYYILATLGGGSNKGDVDDFFDQLVSGIYPVSDPSQTAPYRLREKLLTYRLRKLTRADMIALVFRMWNRHNTLDADGRRIAVDRVQAVRSQDGEGLTNANFPKPKPVLKDC